MELFKAISRTLDRQNKKKNELISKLVEVKEIYFRHKNGSSFNIRSGMILKRNYEWLDDFDYQGFRRSSDTYLVKAVYTHPLTDNQYIKVNDPSDSSEAQYFNMSNIFDDIWTIVKKEV